MVVSDRKHVFSYGRNWNQNQSTYRTIIYNYILHLIRDLKGHVFIDVFICEGGSKIIRFKIISTSLVLCLGGDRHHKKISLFSSLGTGILLILESSVSCLLLNYFSAFVYYLLHLLLVSYQRSFFLPPTSISAFLSSLISFSVLRTFIDSVSIISVTFNTNYIFLSAVRGANFSMQL